MSNLTDLQPTIFFASCTLKGLFWIPYYFVPELFLTKHELDDEEDPLLQDHHHLLLERICHSTNIFALIGIVSFYAFNPRLWQYRHYGWWLTALLVLQHIPQQVVHEGWLGIGWAKTPGTPPRHPSIADDDIYQEEDQVEETAAAAVYATAADIALTNRVFATIGVVLVQSYCLCYGHKETLNRLAAEPFFVFLALVSILLETHTTFLCVWLVPQSLHHVSHAVNLYVRYFFGFFLLGVLVAAGVYHRRVHKREAKELRKQLKTVNTKPKMKFV